VVGRCDWDGTCLPFIPIEVCLALPNSTWGGTNGTCPEEDDLRTCVFNSFEGIQCGIFSESNCKALEGEFYQNDSNCFNDTWVLGSCCIISQCRETTDAVCNQIGGTWIEGAPCPEGGCLDVESYIACCISDIFCFNINEQSCIEYNGTTDANILTYIIKQCSIQGTCFNTNNISIVSETIDVPSDAALSSLNFSCLNCTMNTKNLNLTSVYFTPVTASIQIQGQLILQNSSLVIQNTTMFINGSLSFTNSNMNFDISPESSSIIIRNCSELSGTLNLHINPTTLQTLKSSGNLTKQIMQYGCLTSKFSSVTIDTDSPLDCNSQIKTDLQYGVYSLSILFNYIPGPCTSTNTPAPIFSFTNTPSKEESGASLLIFKYLVLLFNLLLMY